MENLEKVTSFVAIDFETVRGTSSVNGRIYNRLPCAVGLVRYVNGVEMQKYYTLLNPECDGEWKCEKGGITPVMVKDAPTLLDVFSDIQRIKRNIPLVSHNASCEKEVLGAFGEIYDGIDFGTEEDTTFIFYDTLDLLKSLNETDNKLSDACLRHGIEMGTAHNALDDADACARLFLKLQDVERVAPQPGESEQMDFGKAAHKRRDTDYLKPCPEDEIIDRDNPFYHKVTLFTGEFGYISRDDLLQKLYYLGAINKSSVTKSLEVIITGRNPGSSKMKKTMELISQGKEIQVITEDELKEILSKYL